MNFTTAELESDRLQAKFLSDEGLDIANWIQDMVNVSFTATISNMAQLCKHIVNADYHGIKATFGVNFLKAVGLYYQHHNEPTTAKKILLTCNGTPTCD